MYLWIVLPNILFGFVFVFLKIYTYIYIWKREIYRKGGCCVPLFFTIRRSVLWHFAKPLKTLGFKKIYIQRELSNRGKEKRWKRSNKGRLLFSFLFFFPSFFSYFTSFFFLSLFFKILLLQVFGLFFSVNTFSMSLFFFGWDFVYVFFSCLKGTMVGESLLLFHLLKRSFFFFFIVLCTALFWNIMERKKESKKGEKKKKKD